MGKKQPILSIEGTAFTVDIKANELRQADNPKNTISFSDMIYRETHYQLNYNKSEKNLPGIFQSGDLNTVKVKVPPKVQLDPVGMAKQYKLNRNEIAGKTDFDIMVNQELFTKRANGVLPVINMAGHDFIVDLRLMELRSTDDLLNTIDLKTLHQKMDESYSLFFRPSTGKREEISEDILSLPKGVVVIDLPDDRKLDPFGFARKYKLDVKNFLLNHPLTAKLTGKVIPLSQTAIPELIKKNRIDALVTKVMNNEFTLRRGRHF